MHVRVKTVVPEQHGVKIKQEVSSSFARVSFVRLSSSCTTGRREADEGNVEDYKCALLEYEKRSPPEPAEKTASEFVSVPINLR